MYATIIENPPVKINKPNKIIELKLFFDNPELDWKKRKIEVKRHEILKKKNWGDILSIASKGGNI